MYLFIYFLLGVICNILWIVSPPCKWSAEYFTECLLHSHIVSAVDVKPWWFIICTFFLVFSLLDLSYSKHGQVWSPWKHSLCPLILVCDVFFEQYRTVLVNDQLDAQFFFYIFISILYMFQTTSCPSSEESIVSIQHLVRVTLCRWPFI
jgi:hypothetical protein